MPTYIIDVEVRAVYRMAVTAKTKAEACDQAATMDSVKIRKVGSLEDFASEIVDAVESTGTVDLSAGRRVA